MSSDAIFMAKIQRILQKPKTNRFASDPLRTNGGFGPAPERVIDEFMGICKGVIADGKINASEVEFLMSWLEKNKNLIDVFPINVLAARFVQAMEDGAICEKDLHDLAETVKKLVGEEVEVGGISKSLATRLPLDDPQPAVIFDRRTFCFTGGFYFGTRRACEDEVLARGGFTKSGVSNSIDYLVIGLIANPAWIHGSYGRKIESAVEMRAGRKPIAIISEEHWTDHL